MQTAFNLLKLHKYVNLNLKLKNLVKEKVESNKESVLALNINILFSSLKIFHSLDLFLACNFFGIFYMSFYFNLGNKSSL